MKDYLEEKIDKYRNMDIQALRRTDEERRSTDGSEMKAHLTALMVVARERGDIEVANILKDWALNPPSVYEEAALCALLWLKVSGFLGTLETTLITLYESENGRNTIDELLRRRILACDGDGWARNYFGFSKEDIELWEIIYEKTRPWTYEKNMALFKDRIKAKIGHFRESMGGGWD